jgi:hypothetical protein
LIATNGPEARDDARWIARARISLPVPDSPVRRTVVSVGATFETCTRMLFQLFATPTIRPKPSREASSSVSDATRCSSFFASLTASAARRASPARRSCESASATWSATCWASGMSPSPYVPGDRERKRRPPANCHWPSKKIGTLRSERTPSAERCRHLSESGGTSFSTSRTISVDQSFDARAVRLGDPDRRADLGEPGPETA